MSLARAAALAGMASSRVSRAPMPPAAPGKVRRTAEPDRLDASTPPIRIVFSDGKTDIPLTARNADRLLAGLPHLRKAWDALQEPDLGAYLQGLRRRSGTITIRLIDDRNAGEKVWPHARGDEIEVGEAYFSGFLGGLKGRKAGIRNLLAHEFAHTQDRSAGEDDPYGLDGKHQTPEIIRKSAAMAEGWANYHGLRFDPLRRFFVAPLEASSLLRVKEDDRQAGKYRWHPINSFDDDLGNEMVVARTLLRLESEVPGGGEKLARAFEATGDAKTPRTLEALVSRLVRDNPADAGRMILVFDSATGFRAPDSRLLALFGPAAKAYLSPARKVGRRVARTPVIGWLSSMVVKGWLRLTR